MAKIGRQGEVESTEQLYRIAGNLVLRVGIKGSDELSTLLEVLRCRRKLGCEVRCIIFRFFFCCLGPISGIFRFCEMDLEGTITEWFNGNK